RQPESLLGSALESLSDGSDDVPIVREEDQPLPRNLFSTDPDREFTGAPRHQLGVDSQFFLQRVRHPGGSWLVRGSDQTVADDDFLGGDGRFHYCSLGFTEPRWQVEQLMKWPSGFGSSSCIFASCWLIEECISAISRAARLGRLSSLEKSS